MHQFGVTSRDYLLVAVREKAAVISGETGEQFHKVIKMNTIRDVPPDMTPKRHSAEAAVQLRTE